MQPAHIPSQPGGSGTPVSPHDAVLASLRGIVSNADTDALPDILGRVESERLRGEARLRTLAGASEGAPASAGDELLTLQQVADFMSVPSDYAYTLARQRKIPTVRLPGLDRGGRTTSGKYVRVRRSALVAWLARFADDPLGPGVGQASTHRRRRARAATA